MRVTVISASPKGGDSITFHTVLYFQKHFPDVSFEYFHIGKSRKCWDDAFTAMTSADMLLFCYPVYTFLAPSRLHEFMALAKERVAAELCGKPYVQVTTSKHFYDITAHQWVMDNCADMGMKYLGGLSADMDDLLCDKGRKEALDFWRLVSWRYSNAASIPVQAVQSAEFEYDGLLDVTEDYDSPENMSWLDSTDPIPESPKVKDTIVVVTSLDDDDIDLYKMIQDFAESTKYKVEVFNVDEFPFKGSCISCFNCAGSGKCIYADKFDSFLRGNILTARAIVYAYRIKDHSMGTYMKIYDDRQFCNGHRTVTMGMPIGFIVAGDLTNESNLQVLMKARADVGGNFNAGIATTKAEISQLAATIEFALEQKLAPTRMFWGVGGMKIFRDLIWMMQGLMREDHKFFKSHGQYDFPQNRRGDMYRSYLIGALMNNRKLRAKAGGKISEGMIGPYKEALEK